MGSLNGVVAEADQCSYNASKGGVHMITKSLAIELAPYNIQVNALGPGFILKLFRQRINLDTVIFCVLIKIFLYIRFIYCHFVNNN